MDTELASLSESKVIQGLERHVFAEQAETAQVVRHLAEVERRKLYAELGYASSFLYLTKACGYHAASAMRRIHAARAAVKVPEVLDCLKSGDLTLSSASLIAGVMKDENGKALLETFKGKTAREAEEIATAMRPVPVKQIKEKIVPIAVATEQVPTPSLFAPAEDKKEENSDYFRRGSSAEKRTQISFSVDDDFMTLLNRAKEISFRGKKEDVSLENVLTRALRAYLSKEDPKEHQARRKVRPKRKSRHEGTQDVSAKRSVPGPLRDLVLERDDFQCTYIGSSGARCCSRVNLQVDHQMPVALGGETSSKNLRTLCATHNLSEARRFFGTSYVESRIVAKKMSS